MGLFRGEFEDEFAEEGIGPGEPWASEVGWVVLVECLVHEVGVGGGVAQGLETEGYFGVVGGGEGADGDGHGPDIAEADVGAADAFCRRATKEVGVIRTEGEAAGGLVERAMKVDGTEVGKAEETGGVGVVHAEGVADRKSVV